jgi:hypothetical protein
MKQEKLAVLFKVLMYCITISSVNFYDNIFIFQNVV